MKEYLFWVVNPVVLNKVISLQQHNCAWHVKFHRFQPSRQYFIRFIPITKHLNNSLLVFLPSFLIRHIICKLTLNPLNYQTYRNVRFFSNNIQNARTNYNRIQFPVILWHWWIDISMRSIIFCYLPLIWSLTLNCPNSPIAAAT